MPDNSFASLGATLQRALPAGGRTWLGKWAPWILFVGLLILAAWLAARLTWQFVPSADRSGQDAAHGAPVTHRSPADQAPAEQIAAAHLFGIPSAPAARAGGENAPETSLDLTLIGVAAGTKGAASQAIIANGSSHDETTYPVGATLPGGAIIREILPDRVILAHTGRLETLRLPIAGTSILAAGMSFDGQGAHASIGGIETGGGPLTLREPGGLAQHSLSATAQLLHVTPYVQQGHVEGYTVYPGTDPELFNDSGLKPGDVVLSVNGASGMQIMQQLSQLRNSSGPAHVVVLRKGKKLNITINPPGG